MVSTSSAAQPRSPQATLASGLPVYAGDTGAGSRTGARPAPRDSRLLQLVELKNGETYNGHLVSCDNWMNINLREVICTSRDGDKFWRMPECYIRGSTIKYLRIPDEIIDMVKEEVVSKGRGRGGMQQQKQQKGRGVGGAGRGVFGGRGRGIPGSGRGQQEKKPGRQSAKQ
ncbi:unnamed protein product [Bubo scandiacus]